MVRNGQRMLAALLLLCGLCVMVFLGRAPGAFVGAGFAFLAFVATLGSAVMQFVMLALLCCVGIGITLHVGATPAFVMDELSQLWRSQDRMALFLSPWPDGRLRLGFGLLGAGICALALAALSRRGKSDRF